MSGFDNEVMYATGERLEPSSSIAISIMQATSSDVSRINYVGDPNGSVSANPSSLSHDPVSGEVWVKKTGTGNTGWSQVASDSDVDPIGSLQYFANENGDTYVTDRGWLKCNGQILSQSTYSTLFSRVGLINGGGEIWVQQESPTGSNLLDVAYGLDYLAGGVNGALLTSTDAQTWSTVTSAPASSTINAVMYGGSLYVIGFQQNIATSTDTSVWSSTFTAFSSTDTITDLAYGSSTFVAIGNSSVGISTATDASTWTSTKNVFVALRVLYGNSIFLQTSTLRVATSTDGLIFTTKSPVVSYLSYLNSNWIALDRVSGRISTSTDGTNWRNSLLNTTTIYDFTDVAYGNGRYAATSSVSSANMLTSTDAITWASVNTGTTASLQAITYGNSLFVGVGFGSRIVTSTDAVTWGTATFTSGSVQGSDVTYGNSIYLICCASTVSAFYTSTDAVTWTLRTAATSTLWTTVTYLNSIFLAGAGEGVINTSTDGITWAAQASGTTRTINSFFYTGSMYVYGCVQGINTTPFLASSTDAVTWTPATVPWTTTNSGVFNSGIGYDGTNFKVIVGNSAANNVYTSTDLVTWSNNITVTTASFSFQSVGYDSDSSQFLFGSKVNANSNPSVFTTTDQISYVEHVFPFNVTSTQFTSIVYGNGVYVAKFSGVSGFYTSSDLATWSFQTPPSASSNYVIHGNNNFVSVGNSGVIQTSADDYPYNPATQFMLPTDAQIGITMESTDNFKRNLYIKALQV